MAMASVLFYVGICASDEYGNPMCHVWNPPWVDSTSYKVALEAAFNGDATGSIVLFSIFVGFWIVLGFSTYFVNPVRMRSMGVSIVMLVGMLLYGVMLFTIGLATIAQEDKWSIVYFPFPALFALLGWVIYAAATRSLQGTATDIDHNRLELSLSVSDLKTELNRLDEEVAGDTDGQDVQYEIDELELELRSFAYGVPLTSQLSNPRHPLALIYAERNIRNIKSRLDSYEARTGEMINRANTMATEILATVESPMRWLAEQVEDDASGEFALRLSREYGSRPEWPQD